LSNKLCLKSRKKRNQNSPKTKKRLQQFSPSSTCIRPRKQKLGSLLKLFITP
jgi:hypothetical protein